MSNIKLKIQALGIVMVLFGAPIIHFFRDFLTIIPKSSLVMPLFSLVFFAMMLSKRHFTKIYMPNQPISFTALLFLGFSIFTMFVSPHPIKYGAEIANYIFIFIYFYMLCGVPKNVSLVIVPIVVLVTLFDNFALIVSFILNPLAHLGQRAVISNTAWGDGAGNPSLNSIMGFTGIVASMIIFNKKNLLWKIICVINIFSGIVVILLTLMRATILQALLCLIAYIIFNWKHIFRKNTKPFLERTVSKSNIYIYTTLCFLFFITLYIMSDKILNAIDLYWDTTLRVTEKALNTVLGGLEGKDKDADPSAGNRVTTFKHSMEVLNNNPLRYIFGMGYRYLYVDIPFVQVLLETGIIGFIFYVMFFYQTSKYSLQAGFTSDNDWLKLLVFYFIGLLINAGSRGEPYDPYFWNYFFTIARFMKPEYMKIASFKNQRV